MEEFFYVSMQMVASEWQGGCSTVTLDLVGTIIGL